MKTLESFEFTRAATKSTYDWAAILDGKVHVMEAGKDFTCKAQTLKMQTRKIAKKMGLAVKTASTKDGDVVIQSYTPDEGTEFEKAKRAADKKAKKAENPAAGGKPAADETDEEEVVEDEDEDEDEDIEEEVVEDEEEEEVKKPARRRR